MRPRDIFPPRRDQRGQYHPGSDPLPGGSYYPSDWDVTIIFPPEDSYVDFYWIPAERWMYQHFGDHTWWCCRAPGPPIMYRVKFNTFGPIKFH